MDAMTLFELIGNARDKYVLEAEQLRSGKVPAMTRCLPKKRLVLMAAIIALTALLVGCAVVYALRLQNMKIGEYRYTGKTPQSITLISLQGTHLEAMTEWLAFVEDYDSDHMIAVEAESKGVAADIPEAYSGTYGCYTREMADKLDEIIRKYDLKLLSRRIPFMQGEGSRALELLGIESLHLKNDWSNVSYLDGYYYPEGTFELNLFVSMEGKDWKCTDNPATYRYSRKDYFDPVYGAVSDPDAYTQWDYTRMDGTKVLLAMNREFARIYIDLADAFLSISMEACEWEEGGVRIPMTKKALEQIAELPDLTIQPQPSAVADGMATPVKLDAAEYEEIVSDYIASIPNPENGSYLLYDLNSDGIEELLINGWGIYSMENGVPYEYMDRDKLLTILPLMRPCEGNIVEIYLETDGALAEDAWYFYRAESQSMAYIVGVTYNNRTDVWTLIPDDDRWTENDRQIPEAEARQILDSYSRVEFDWRPVQKYGQPYTPVATSDPYAKYISQMMNRYDEAAEYQYLLMDLNEDGIEELITRDNRVEGPYGQEQLLLNIHTIENGELKKLASGIDHVCEGGILEETQENYDPRDLGEFWRYSRLTENGLEFVEKIVQDPVTDIWGRVEYGKDGRDVTEVEAMAVVNAYRAKRLDLQMKPFSEYPMN